MRTEFASVGDVIECSVQNPQPSTLYALLATPEACAFGNALILTGRWKKTPPEIASELKFKKQDANALRLVDRVGGDA